MAYFIYLGQPFIQKEHHLPFPYRSESEAFGKALFDMAVRAHRERISQYVNKENMHIFQHGRNYLTVREDGTEESSFKEVGVELSIKYEDIINNDINQLFKFIGDFIEGLTSQAMQGMFQKISETCDKVGHTINQNEYTSQAEALLEMLRKIEFTVDENGKVALPQIHIAPDNAKYLIQSLQEQSDEFHAEIEKIKIDKSEAAINKEMHRLNRYKGINK